MKKGFTLIELLAVLAILAILALITTPIITDVIDKSRQNTFKASVEALKHTVDLDYTENARTGAIYYNFADNTLVCQNCDYYGEPLEINYTGKIDGGEGYIINENGKITLEINTDRYVATNNEDDEVIVNKN